MGNFGQAMAVPLSTALVYQVICGGWSTGKCLKAGKANCQHQGLTEKGNIHKMSKKDECACSASRVSSLSPLETTRRSSEKSTLGLAVVSTFEQINCRRIDPFMGVYGDFSDLQFR